METKRSLSVRCWGTRGSVPTPGRATVKYGGNTSCVEVRAGEERIVFDAGTGVLGLGEKLVSEGPLKPVSIFLTHFHWDHIHGLPFFAPAYDPDFQIRILGPAQEGLALDSVLRSQMGPVHFPLPYEALSAQISFQELSEGWWEGSEISVRSLRVRHASYTVGYRLEALDRSVVLIPDNELVGGTYDVPADWMDKLVGFVGGADLLIHDAMFTSEEYQDLEGWGHSTFSQALALAKEAGVKKLLFFHHSPRRTDVELDRIVRAVRKQCDDRGITVELGAAEEDVVLTVGGGPNPG